MRRRALLLTTALALLGTAGSLTLWSALRAHERSRLVHATRAEAHSLMHEFDVQLETRVDATRALAALWAERPFTSRAAWLHDAELYAKSHQLASIARVAPGPDGTWVASPSRNGAPQPADAKGAATLEAAIRRAEDERVETTAGPFALAGETDRYALWLIFPVHRRDSKGSDRILIATLDLAAFTDDFLTARARDYTVSMGVAPSEGSSAGEEFYHRGSIDPHVQPVTVSIESAGIHLQGTVRPSPALAAQEITPLPEIVLASGLVISASLAALVWLAHLTQARARSLAEANRAIGHEIAATRSAEAALRKLNTELEQRVAGRTAELRDLVAELEAFNYSVSHDLRSPLGAVVNFASLLEEDYGDTLGAQGQDYLARISGSAESALTLMDGLLAFSRLGREELRRSHVDVQALVASVVDELRVQDPRPDAEIDVGPLPPAHADPTMLRLVFSNLVSNALKFSRGRDLPRVEIGAFEDEGGVVYYVKDNGVGFDPDLSYKLFSVFERLHSREQFGGSGVGLATSARIVRRHGGRIWAEGALDAGASFYFTLGDQGSTLDHQGGRGSHDAAS